jgi:hypothetical protein
MNIVYHKWFDIEVIHDYFVNGVCKDVTIIPFSETAERFSKYQILIRKQENITSFYVGVNESESNTLGENLESLGELYFQLITEDFLFYNYSEIPTTEEDQILLFENEPARNRLHVNDTITNDDLEDWTQFRESHSLINSPLDDRRIGIINMHATGIGALQAEPPRYIIQLRSRAVHFRYKVVVAQSSNTQLTPIKVSFPNESTPSFHGPTPVELTGSQLAQAFTSKDPIKLEEELTELPLLTLTYQDLNTPSRVRSDEIKLPNPSAESLETIIDPNGNTKLSTSTIVYV